MPRLCLLRVAVVLACVLSAVSAAENANLKVTYGPIAQTFINPCTGDSVSRSYPKMDVGATPIRPLQTQSQPWITWDYDTSKVYSVQLQDIEGSFTHMFAANVVPPNIGSAANTLLFPYFPPLNPTTTPHHYTFIVYEQPGFINVSSTLLAKIAANPLFARASWGYQKFVSDNKLVQVATLANSGYVDEWVPFMWNELLDAPFITSAEKQGLAPYYAQACANKWPVDDQDDAATAAPAPAATSMELSVQYGAQSISFVNPCNSEPESVDKAPCNVDDSACQGSQTASIPWLTWGANSTKKYTVMLVDVTGGFTHCMFMNVIGGSVSFGSNEVFPYFPPANPSATAHDYTWMVYEQVNWVTVPQSVLNNVAANPLTARLNFDYESLVEGMTMVATKVNKGVVEPWTAYFYKNFLASPVVPANLKSAFAPYYKMTCSNYPAAAEAH